MRSFTLRLQPGEDLKSTLDLRVVEESLQAVFILAAVGSLTQAHIPFAGASAATTLTAGPFEILTLSGTLGAESGSHLHISLSDATGKVVGGHLCPGSIIFTTAEIVLGVSQAERYRREPDPRTGYRELQVDPLDS